ncbi:MAG TPA: hypothetical protein VGF76_21625 [Polyangiaceae bacterium]
MLALTLISASNVACAGSHADDGGTPPGVFVAFSSDFKDFRTWQSFDVTMDADAGALHPEAMLMEYLNRAPPSGSTEFPIGTIIVKQINGDLTKNDQYFAMVKRGAPQQPNGWEWFGLYNADDAGTPDIAWRGGPPSTAEYGGDPTSCNRCHITCDNDYVCAPPLKLSSF